MSGRVAVNATGARHWTLPGRATTVTRGKCTRKCPLFSTVRRTLTARRNTQQIGTNHGDGVHTAGQWRPKRGRFQIICLPLNGRPGLAVRQAAFPTKLPGLQCCKFAAKCTGPSLPTYASRRSDNEAQLAVQCAITDLQPDAGSSVTAYRCFLFMQSRLSCVCLSHWPGYNFNFHFPII